MLAVIGANESCEETLRLRVAVEWSIVIGSCTLGIKTHKQQQQKKKLTTSNVMDASCDLLDESMEI